MRLSLLLGVVMLAGCAAHAETPPDPPILSASQPWEQHAVFEPNVWTDAAGWHMVYTGGWNTSALGYATARSADGPWVKHGPIIGLGHGGWSGSAARSSVLRDRGLLYVYFTEPEGSALHVAVGPDIAHLRLAGPVLTGYRVVNTSVVRDGGRFRLLFEANVGGFTHWLTGLADAASPLGPFTVRVFPLRSLQLSPDGTAGGPDLHRAAGRWVLLYHAVRHGTLPSDVYEATSTDLVHWSGRRMVVGRPHIAGVDQTADPVRVGGRVFFSVVDNPKALSWIAVTTTG